MAEPHERPTSRPRRGVVAAAVVVVTAVAGGMLLLGGDGGQEWREVEPGPFSPLTAGAPRDVEVEAGAARAGTSGHLVLHNQGAEPVELQAVEAVDVSEGVAEVHVDGRWPGDGEEVRTAGELHPYPADELVVIAGTTLAPAGEERSSLQVPVGIRLTEGAARGGVGGFDVRFRTPAGRFVMHVDHSVAVVTGG